MERVYFGRHVDPETNDIDEFAAMVDTMNGSKVQVYSHEGQHADADVEYVKESESIENPEQSDLYKELVGQGYDDIEVVPSFPDPAASETPVDECAGKSVSDVVESVIGGSPICEAVKQIAGALFESTMDYTDPSQVYNELVDRDFFTEAELLLVVKGWGYNMDTLDRVCQVRYAMDADQLLESE
jgi:hypothetical protein